MRTYEGFLTLIEELNGDMADIKRLQSHNSRARDRIESGARDILDYGALAYTVHTIYGVIENYFLRISKFFENSLPRDSWHKNLVERMALNVPGVRPAFIQDEDIKGKVLELLRFRHKFRNLYGEDLNPDRMKEVQLRIGEVMGVFPSFHRDYCEKLRKAAELL